MNFFGLSFLLFFRLPIYESIAAIFWQSASYVSFFCFNPDVHQARQRRLFSGNLPAMLLFDFCLTDFLFDPFDECDFPNH